MPGMGNAAASLEVHVGADTSAAESGLSSLGGKVNSVGTGIQTAMAGAALAIGAGLAAGVAVAVTSAGHLEQAVANISTIKPEIDTSAVFASLNEMSTRIPQTASELGASLYDVFSSVNVSAEEGLQLVEQFAKGAIGASTDAQTFGTAAMGVMNAYGLSVADAGHISDVFFNTIAAGVVTGPELAASLGPVTSSAKAAGVSLDEMGAMIVGVTKAGGPAAQNINNLNNFLQKITTKEAQTQLHALGVATTDSTGAFLPQIDVLRDLKTHLSGMSESAKAMAMQKIFPDAQARQGAQALMDQLDAVDAALVTNRTAVGATEEAYKKMSATFDAQTKLLGQTMMAALTTVGATLLPMITPWVTAFAQQIPTAMRIAGEAINTVKQVLAGDWAPDDSINPFVLAVGNAAIMLRDTFGPAVTAISTFITGTLVPAFLAVAPQLAAFAAGFLGTVGIVGPIVAGLAATLGFLLTPLGLLAIAVGLFAAAWTTNFGGIREITASVIEAVSSAISTGLAAITGFWTTHGDAIKTAASTAWEGVKTAVTTAVEVIKTAVSTGLSTVTSTIDTIRSALTTAVEMGAWENVKTAFSNLGAAVTIAKDRIGEIGAVLAPIAAAMAPTATAADTMAAAMKGLAAGFLFASIQVKGFVDSIGSAGLVALNFGLGLSELGNATRMFATGDLPGAAAALDRAKTAFADGANAAEDFRTRGIERANEAAAAMADVFTTRMPEIPAAIETNVLAAGTTLDGAATDWPETVSAAATGMADGMTTGMDAVVLAAQTGTDGVTAAVEAAVGPATAAADAMGTGMSGALTAAGPVMVDAATVAATGVTTAVEAGTGPATAAATATGTGMTDAIIAAGPLMLDAATIAATGVTTAVDAQTGPATTAATAMGAGMTTGVETAIPTMTAAGEKAATGAVTAVSGQVGAASGAGTSLGSALGSGMEGGIMAYVGRVAAAARALVTAAINAAQAAGPHAGGPGGGGGAGAEGGAQMVKSIGASVDGMLSATAAAGKTMGAAVSGMSEPITTAAADVGGGGGGGLYQTFFDQVGLPIAQGTAGGITAGAPGVTDAIVTALTTALGAATAAITALTAQVTALVTKLGADVGLATGAMANDVKTKTTDMGTVVTTTVSDMATAVTTKTGQMSQAVTGTFGTLAKETSLTMANMGLDVVTKVGDMGKEVVKAVQTMKDDATTAVETLSKDTKVLMDKLTMDVKLAIADMKLKVTQDFRDTSLDAIKSMEDLSHGAMEEFDNVVTAADTVTPASEGVSKALASIKPPNMSGVIHQFEQVGKAAEKATKAVQKLAKATHKSGKGGDFESEGAAHDDGRAMGGTVYPGLSYMVGERGPEMFSPGLAGRITPHNQLGDGGGATTIVNVHVNGSLLANRRDIEEAVILGLESARARGRV